MAASEQTTIDALRRKPLLGCLVLAPILVGFVLPLVALILALPAYALFRIVASVHALLATW